MFFKLYLSEVFTGSHLSVLLINEISFYKRVIVQGAAVISRILSGRGIIRRAPRSLAAKSIGAREVQKVISGQEGVAAS